jgi:hypothetical protein
LAFHERQFCELTTWIILSQIEIPNRTWEHSILQGLASVTGVTVSAVAEKQQSNYLKFQQQNIILCFSSD